MPLPGGCFSRPGLGPAADCPFLIRQERSDQRRRPGCPRPSASLRATCVVAVAGFAVKLSSRCALRSNITASQITKQSCPSAGLQPRNHHAAGADIRGVGAGLRFARPFFGRARRPKPLSFRPAPCSGAGASKHLYRAVQPPRQRGLVTSGSSDRGCLPTSLRLRTGWGYPQGRPHGSVRVLNIPSTFFALQNVERVASISQRRAKPCRHGRGDQRLAHHPAQRRAAGHLRGRRDLSPAQHHQTRGLKHQPQPTKNSRAQQWRIGCFVFPAVGCWVLAVPQPPPFCPRLRWAGCGVAALPKDRAASSSDLPQLFERSAPARSEFCGTPRIPPNAGRPQRSEGSWAVWGALLCFLSYRAIRKGVGRRAETRPRKTTTRQGQKNGDPDKKTEPTQPPASTYPSQASSTPPATPTTPPSRPATVSYTHLTLPTNREV